MTEQQTCPLIPVARTPEQFLTLVKKSPHNSIIIFDEAGVIPMMDEKRKCTTCGHPLQCHAFFADIEGKFKCFSQIKKQKAVFRCTCSDFK